MAETVEIEEKSLVDLFQYLPDWEKEIAEEALEIIKTNYKITGLREIMPPEIEKYFYVVWRGNYLYTFACNSCDRWIQEGHHDNCAVGDIAQGVGFDHARFYKEHIGGY